MWIELDGAVNVRDLGGLPLADGTRTTAHRLIRADNLQGLSQRDVRLLVDEYQVRSVVDLRTSVEVTSEGPGPLTAEPNVRFTHASLYEETAPASTHPSQNGDSTPLVHTDAGPVVLP